MGFKFEIPDGEEVHVEDLITAQEVDRPDIAIQFSGLVGHAIERAGGEVDWLEETELADVINLDDYRQAD